jgi:hypothetical protein
VFLVVRRFIAACLIGLLSTSPLLSAPSLSTLRGSLRLEDGTIPTGIDLRLVHLDTGRVVSPAVDSKGAFETPLEPGLYGVDVGRRGYEIVSGPRVVSASPGQMVAAALEVTRTAPPPAVGPRIAHDALGCMVAGENPEIEAVMEPASAVTHPRVYFKSSKESSFHYVEMLPEIGRFVACLPQPKPDAGPVTYYLSASADGVESRTADVAANVVTRASTCPAGAKLALACPCAGPVPTFVVGGAPSAPAGFSGALAGVSGATSTAAGIAIGISAIGIGLMIGDSGPASPSR